MKKMPGWPIFQKKFVKFMTSLMEDSSQNSVKKVSKDIHLLRLVPLVVVKY